MREILKKYIVLLLIVIIINLSLIFTYCTYYFSKQSNVTVIPEEYFHIINSDTSNLNDLAREWVDQYILQYTQKYLPRRKIVKWYNITDVEILDEKSRQVSVKFNMEPKVKNSTIFSDWGYRLSDGTYECEWIVMLDDAYINRGKIWFITQRINRASYELSQYNQSDQKLKDEEYYGFMDKKKYDDLNRKCTYKIEDSKLYFTYDNSKTWVNINIPEFEEMVEDDTYKLDDKLFRIDEKLTYIYYKGMVAISKDMSKTFKIIDCKNLKDVVYVYFKDENTGYIVSALDFAMGRYAPGVYKTIDGSNFEEIDVFSSLGWLGRDTNIYAFNENLVYIVDTRADLSSTSLLVSTDGFKTFSKLEIPKGKFENEEDNITYDFFEIYDTFEMPILEDGKYNLIIGQGSDGDYRGGTKVLYESEDGINWNFVKEFIEEPKDYEG